MFTASLPWSKAAYVRVIPDANMRQQSLPVISGKESYRGRRVRQQDRHAEERSGGAARADPAAAAAAAVAHLVALPCKNTLLVTDTFASVKRIEQIARALDVGEAVHAAVVFGRLAAQAGLMIRSHVFGPA